ncbi:MAG: helix-turn-helix domain-containing protein [Spirochaeta sp.]|jgi:cytoskeleton protein RodZ|nr:helix-turn-helix domain-containing protein [Spirochaeta sp.]
MDSIGTKLKSARAAKGVSVEQVVRDTHITRRFIEAMEEEDFEQFPGEAYLLGFLRNYASYLGLAGEEIVSLYQNIKIQEQPAPIDELLDRKVRRPLPLGPILIVLAVLVVAGVLALFLTGVVTIPSLDRGGETAAEAVDELFVLNEPFVERRFLEGDRIAIPVDGENATIEFVEVGERVAIGSEAGIVHLAGSERRVLDITGEGSADISVSIRQIYREEGETPSVVVRVDRVIGRDAPEEPPAAAVSDAERTELALGQTIEPSRQVESRVVAQFPTLQEYFIEADFRGLTMFRWEVDDTPREERYLQNGDRVRTSVRDIVRIWASNAGNVRLRVAGNPVELGDQGEVVAAVIRWSETEDGGYQLELLPQY